MELLRWVLFFVLAWYLPGIAVARSLRSRLGLSAAAELAVCWCAGPVAYGLLAVPLGIARVEPWVPALVVAVAGTGSGLRPGALREWWQIVRRSPVVFALPLVFAVFVGLAADPLDLRSDSYAHLSAVRATIDEAAIFPVRGFHGDAASAGADPRFGTLHALYGVAVVASGSDLQTAWNVVRAAGAALLVSGGLALLASMAISPSAAVVGVLALFATTGGGYYNAFGVAAYPLWFSLGIIWTLCALALASFRARAVATGVCAAATLAALVGMHFFAFMLGGFLLGGIALATPRGERGAALRMLAVASVLAAPFVVLRFVTSYANANPIHQKVWQCMEWAPGLYAANPLFVAQWLFPFGLGALGWGLLRWRRCGGELHFRWLMIVAAIVLVWTGVPWLLTPSMELIGFLPLRLMMAVGTPFLLALLIDRQSRHRGAVLGLVVLLLLPAAVVRATGMFARHESGVVGSADWVRMLDALPAGGSPRTVLASDPFSMMAVQALRDVDVVAVPDGRSSPRDPLAIERLRDAWRIMSPTVDGRWTEAALRRQRVTHVLVNEGLPPGTSSYEYPTADAVEPAQLAKFLENGVRFERVWSGGQLTLFAVDTSAGQPWDESWLRSCGAPATGRQAASIAVGDSYVVVDPQVEIEDGRGARRLRIDGGLAWTGDGAAPDRQLIVRLDRTPSPVPEGLRFAAKPLRKLRERLEGTVYRYRWTTYPAHGGCPTWVAAEHGPLALGLSFALPGSMESGRYDVSLAVRDRSIFVPIRWSDLFVDDDSYQGPVIGSVELP